MCCYAFVGFCTTAARVLNFCRSLINKQPLRPPLGLLHCHHKDMGVIGVRAEPFFCSENRGCPEYEQATIFSKQKIISKRLLIIF